MKLIKHMIFVDVDDTKKLVINSLNGSVDEIEMPTYETLRRWQSVEHIVAENEQEVELQDTLRARGYLVENFEEETMRKKEILDALRENHVKDRKHCHHLTFVMTYNCNFRCPYCFEGEASLKKDVITPKQIDAALELAGDSLQTVCLFGGEPLLPATRPSIEYLFSKAPDKRYSVITNGYYLEEFADLLNTVKIVDITVTLDGKEATHNSRRYLANGKPTYNKILSGVQKALETGLTIKIRVNASDDTYDEGMALQQSLREQFSEYSDLLIFEMVPMLDYSEKQKSKMVTDMFCAVKEQDKAERLRRNSGFAFLTPLVSSFIVGVPAPPLYSFCYAHKNNLAVDPYGNFYTCLVTVGRDHMATGKYYPSVEYKEHSIFNRNIDKIPECGDCTYSLLCGGGCPINLKDYSDLYKPACAFTKNAIHELLPSLYRAENDIVCV